MSIFFITFRQVREGPLWRPVIHPVINTSLVSDFLLDRLATFRLRDCGPDGREVKGSSKGEPAKGVGSQSVHTRLEDCQLRRVLPPQPRQPGLQDLMHAIELAVRV